jgi:hypothetical protein
MFVIMFYTVLQVQILHHVLDAMYSIHVHSHKRLKQDEIQPTPLNPIQQQLVKTTLRHLSSNPSAPVTFHDLFDKIKTIPRSDVDWFKQWIQQQQHHHVELQSIQWSENVEFEMLIVKIILIRTF